MLFTITSQLGVRLKNRLRTDNDSIEWIKNKQQHQQLCGVFATIADARTNNTDAWSFDIHQTQIKSTPTKQPKPENIVRLF